MTEQIWQKVAKTYIKSGQFPFPVTDTMIEILKLLLTEEQANFLLNFKKPSYNIEELKKKINLEETYLNQMLAELSDLGAVTALPSRSTGIMVYRLPPFFPGLLEFTLMKGNKTEKDRKFAQLWQVYFKEIVDTFQKNYDTLIPLLEKQSITIETIIPVNEEVEAGEEITLNMEDLSKFIESQETIGLATCYCRHRKDLLDEPCKKTKDRKNCFGFGRAAEFLIEHGFAEKVTKEKAIEILQKCEDDGLVHKAFHSALDPTKEIDGLCACCDCCCGTFSNHYAGGLPLMSLTSFIAIIDADKCAGCGTCVEMCNAKAIVLVDLLAVLNEKRCLGCGVCAHLCPEDAIVLQRIDPKRVFVPPPRIKTE